MSEKIEIVKREHEIKIFTTKPRWLEDTQKVEKIFKLKEYYKHRLVDEWEEDSSGNKVICCGRYTCYNYKRSETIWRYQCPDCDMKDRKALKISEMRDKYQVKFRERLSLLIKEIRERKSHFKVRKARKRNSMYASFGISRITPQEKQDAIKEINVIGLEFNLAVREVLRAPDNISYRYEILFKDIDPLMREVEWEKIYL